MHRLLALIFVIGVCQHLLPTTNTQFRVFVSYLGALVGFGLIRAITTLHQNIKWGEQSTRAILNDRHGVTHVRLHMPRPMKIDAGQYILLWVPRVSVSAPTQVHPFVVVSWAEVEQNSIEIIVRSRRGFSERLSRHCQRYGGRNIQRRALLSGPHGISIPVWDYRAVLLIASGSGVAAVLPYLTKLIHGYYFGKGCTRRVHLIWQIQDLGR